MYSSIKRRSSAFRTNFLGNLTRLEERSQPSVAGYTPPSNYWMNPDLSAVDPRLGQQPPLAIALNYLNGHAADFGATPADLADALVTSQYTDADTGIAHLYLRQRVNGLQVANADLAIGIAANGAIISIGGGFVSDLQNRLMAPTTPAMTPAAALTLAAAELNLPLEEAPELIDSVVGPVQQLTLSAPSIAFGDITASLHYVPTADGSAVLAWELIVETRDGQHWYDLSVDSANGQIVALADWIDNDSYSGLKLPNDSPVDGGFSIDFNPAHPSASPFGWHDTNGVAGGEFTTTVGNNVDAHLDRNADNAADTTPPRPDGGSSRDFGFFPFNAAAAPATLQNENAAVVNLFYMNNMIHDINYQYGFTEAAGNFQTNNYGKGGIGNDAVQADAQDGSGTNNANFGTPVDGSAPRMQMFEWTQATPDRDSDLDNGIIIHEYTHGVSNRLTGGPANSSALNNVQSGGMGEGWGDFFGLMFEQRASDAQNGAYGIGTYVINQAPTGGGIRRFRYSYDMSIASDPLTFDAYGSSGTTPYGVTRTTQVHNAGEIWCSTLWDMNWLLINKYGFDPYLQTGWSNTSGASRAGNKLTLRLVMDAMKLQPANPSFVQARDAIISADNALTGGANRFEIWSAFARRGLGFGASTPDSNSTATPVLSTVVPMFVSAANPANNKVVATSPTSYVLTITAPVEVATLEAVDLIVNGQPATSVDYTAGATSATFTFATDPVAGNGPQTILVPGSSFNRASDGSPVGNFSSTFFVDATPLQVTSITPASGSIVTLPFTTIDVNLNGPVNPSSVSLTDLNISQGAVTAFTLLNSNTTIRFTIGNLVGEGTVNVGVAFGALADVDGNANSTFTGTYTVDYGTFAFPTPLVKSTAGALIYAGTTTAQVNFSGDADTFTLNLDAGQTLNLTVAAGSTLRPNVTVVGPGVNQSISSASNGATAYLQSVPITTAGTYSLIVNGVGTTTGVYQLKATLNTAIESESVGGSSNDTLAAAQSLTPSFVDLGGGLTRGSIAGTTDLSAAQPEAEPNGAVGTANPVTTASSSPTNLYQFGYSGTISSSTDVDYVSIGALQVGDVLTLAQYGAPSNRGANTDVFVRLYRLGSTNIIASDDDSGPGLDALLYRYSIATADTYYVRAYRAGTANTGTYQVAVTLENTGATPTTGGIFTAEVEPNESRAAANNATNAWRQVKYIQSTSGTITAGDADYFSYALTAGDIVSMTVSSTSALIPQAALVDSANNVLTTEDGTSSVAGAGGFSPIYGYLIPTTGTYSLRVTGGSSTTGTYRTDFFLSTAGTLPVMAGPKDNYAITLAAGESVSLGLKNVSAGAIDFSIVDGANAVLATGVAGSTNFDRFLANFVAPTAGTYFAQIGGSPDIDYQLTATRGGTVDAEANDTFATAQPLGAGGSVLGVIAPNEDWYQISLTAGNTVTLKTATPGDGAGQFDNSLDPALELYDPAGLLVGSDNASAPDGRNALLTRVAGSTGSYRVRVISVGGTTGEYVLNSSVVTAPPPRVSGVTVGVGVQRSQVTSLTVNFDSIVTLPTNVADAFALTRQGGGTVTLAGTAISSPNTAVTLTFTGGSVDFASLADGRYSLTALASLITVGGAGLDGNGDGTAGDDYTLVGDPTNTLFRLFGDADGDGDNDNADFVAFRAAFGTGPSIFDSEGDGDTDIADFVAFRLRFGTMV